MVVTTENIHVDVNARSQTTNRTRKRLPDYPHKRLWALMSSFDFVVILLQCLEDSFFSQMLLNGVSDRPPFPKVVDPEGHWQMVVVWLS